MEGWREGLGPWTPVLDGDRLYGRGGADDGYAVFASLTAIEAVQARGGSHARCVVLIEASEESGSPDLPAYVEALADRIGSPSLVVCLDSGCVDYDQMWITTSLRGMVSRHPHGRHRHRGPALRRRLGHGAVVVPDRPLVAVSDRGRVHRSSAARLVSTSRSPPTASSRRRHRDRDRGDRRPLSRSSMVPARPRLIPPSSCCREPGGPRSAWSAPTGCRRPAVPATCCGRARRSSCRCGCRRPSTPRRSPPSCRAVLHGRPALRCPGHHQRPRDRSRLECPGARAVARVERSTRPPRSPSGSRHACSARAARSRSWACSASDSRRRSS